MERVLIRTKPSKVNSSKSSFNYSLKEMRIAVASKKTKVPKINDVEDLDAWLESC